MTARAALVAVLLCGAAGCAAPPRDPLQVRVQAAARSDEVCWQDEPTGSRLRQTVCASRAELASRGERAEQQMRAWQAAAGLARGR